jgi:hypothetical protein
MDAQTCLFLNFQIRIESLWRILALTGVPAIFLPLRSLMPTAKRIRELCLQATETEGPEFETVLLELANALELYDQAEKENGNKAAAAE